jgi:tetratricopeptide (TPR) repeat protein
MDTELSSSTTGEPTPDPHPVIEIVDIIIPSAAILGGISKVCLATKATDSQVKILASKTANAFPPSGPAYSLRRWHELISKLSLEEDEYHRTSLAITVAFMIQISRNNSDASALDLDFAWSRIREALLTTSITYTISRNTQGFIAVPLWSSVNNGNIVELFRLHVWLPDRREPHREVAIHAHQPFAQSWILTGEGIDHTYKTIPANADAATHAVFSVGWSDSAGVGMGKEYQTHQKFSQIRNTGNLVRIISDVTESHSRGMTYSVPAGVLHSSEVIADTVHATLFLFDASRGFEFEAPVLGPVTGQLFTQKRETEGITTKTLVTIVDALRAWEIYQEQGLEHSQEAKWEEGLRAFRSALKVCGPISQCQQSPCYKIQALGEIGHIFRMMGRNLLASKTLEEALCDVPPNRLRVSLTGELGVVYRHMNRLEDSKRAGQDEYNTAKHLGLEKDMCRALGTLGMVNYQLFLRTRDFSSLDLAVEQLEERVRTARSLKRTAFTKDGDSASKNRLLELASRWEAIGLGRLSLCYAEKGNVDQSIKAALDALNLQLSQNDPTKIAFARYFYGHALLLAGRNDEARAQFNPHNTCTPTIALCKEPSDEHREYIKEMIHAGADMELRDEQGYSALECAVYCGDTATAKVVEEGLRLKFIQDGASKKEQPTPSKSNERSLDYNLNLSHLLAAETRLERLRYEARLRKGYRDMLQDTMRPVLLDAVDNSGLTRLRHEYASALSKDGEKQAIFDGLKVVRYFDFIRCGRIPRSSDGLAIRIFTENGGVYTGDFIIFFSYRWIAHDPGSQSTGDSPDDIYNTQYQRMIRALDLFIQTHPEVDVEKLSIWIVSFHLTIHCSRN